MNNIEKIKAEIERRKKICKGIFERDSDTYYQGKAVAYGELLPFIDSLPEEKPSEDLEEAAGNAQTCNARLTEIRELIRDAKDGFDPFNRKRDTKSVFWRQAIMMQLRREGFSLHQVGRAAGYNHSTVKFSTERVTDAMQGYDPDLLNVWLELQRVIQTQRDK